MLNFWTVRLITFSIWALVAGSATFWILQNVNVASSKMTGNAGVKTSQLSTPTPDNLTPQVATALGAKKVTAPTAASALVATQARLQLQGVVAAGSQSGAALISIDGKPAKPYRTGVAIEEGLEVTSIKARSVAIGSNGTEAFTLELPLKK
ncbi:MAG: type II secretion system protein N [Cytophagales bacterium]|nr:type II secretion system protein N [Cytophagales bacterium]